MSDSAMIEAFFSAWGMEDAEARAATLARSLADTFLYADPRMGAVTDAAALNAMLGQFTANMPGGSAALDAVAGSHNGHSLCTVAFRKDGQTMMTGQYYVETDGAGRIVRAVGFPGGPPA